MTTNKKVASRKLNLLDDLTKELNNLSTYTGCTDLVIT
jgi:hypothetical protein